MKIHPTPFVLILSTQAYRNASPKTALNGKTTAPKTYGANLDEKGLSQRVTDFVGEAPAFAEK